MCEPVSIGIAVASAGMAMYSMNEQNKAQNRQVEAEMKSAEYAQIADTNALREQSQQISEQARDQELQRRREALRERASMRVMSNGASGNSIDRLFNTSYFNEEYDVATVNKNRDNGQMQNYRDLEKVNMTALGRFRNAESQWISGSRANKRLLVSGAQGGLSGYSMGRSFTK